MTQSLLHSRIPPDLEGESPTADPGTAPLRGAPLPAQKNQAVLVLGMHRSGTSALTRMISLLGADLPTDLMPPVKNNNETGFWESLALYHLNEEILASGGSGWDDWRPFNPEWYGTPRARAFKASALTLLRREFGHSPLFVLKDPRICRLLPFWLDVLAEADADVTCVIITRNPLEVAASLQRRDSFSPARSLALWLRHVLDAELATRGMPRAFATYDGLMQDWRGTAALISARTHVAWPRRSAQAEVEIDSFLNTEHRHHVASRTALERNPDVSDWVKAAYGCVLELSSREESPAVHERLDVIRAEFDRACYSFGTILRAVECELEAAKTTAAEDLARARAAAEEQLALLTREHNDKLAGAIAIRRKEAELLSLDCSAQGARVEMLEGLLHRQTAQIRELSASLSARCAENAGLASALQRNEARLAQLESDRKQLSQLLSAALSSASWELASPIRRLELRIPRAVRGATDALKLLWCAVTCSLPRQRQMRQVVRQVVDSGLFDEGWYAEQYAGALLVGVRPAEAWLRTGWSAGHDPCPLFDTSWYLGQNPDVREAGINPLLHYLQSGFQEARDPHPLFDTSWYLEQDAGVLDDGVNPLAHYLEVGADEGRNPHPLFASAWYLDQNPDVAAAGVNPLIHYVRAGGAEGRDPHPLFDGAWYLREYPEGATADNPLVDYLLYGAAAGQDPNPLFRTTVYCESNLPVGQPAEALKHFSDSGRIAVPGAYRSADVLIALQDGFRSHTSLEIVADRRNKAGRYAVLLQCGSGSVHPRWLRSRPRPWDLIVNHYDRTFVRAIDCDLELLQNGVLPGTKFTAMCQLLSQRPALLDPYDYVLLLDDDIQIDEEGITRLFEIATEHGLDLLQASLSHDSSCAHEVFLTRGTPGFRLISAVEIMMPVLSRRSLAIAGHLFCQSVSGWGIDVAMAKLVREQGGQCAVVDEIVARHTKPIDTTNGSYYRMLLGASIQADLELRHLQALYDAPFEFVECAEGD